MPNESAKRKLITLASKVQGRQITPVEDVRIDRVLATAPKPKTRGDVRKLLAESINASEHDVLVKLAASDDNDRILDDIINELGKP